MRTVWVWVATCLACGKRAYADLGGRGFGPHARFDCCPHLEPLLDEWIRARGRQVHEFPRASTSYVVREIV